MDQYTVSSKTPAILTLRPGNVFHVVRRIILTNRSKFPGTIDLPPVWFIYVAAVARLRWFRRRQRGRISAVTMPSNTSIAPIPGRSFSFSFRTRNAVSQANTGSKVKMTAMLAAGITCWAQVWTPKANAVARTPATNSEIGTSGCRRTPPGSHQLSQRVHPYRFHDQRANRQEKPWRNQSAAG